MEKERKTLVIAALIFSAISVIAAFITKDIYMAAVSIILWSCMCFRYNWAKMSKVLLNIIIICIYAVAYVQIFIQYRNSNQPPDIDFMFILKTIVNVIVPIAEITVIYKSKNIRDYFLQEKKNKINTKLK
jgi:hypothetical protein